MGQSDLIRFASRYLGDFPFLVLRLCAGLVQSEFAQSEIAGVGRNCAIDDVSTAFDSVVLGRLFIFGQSLNWKKRRKEKKKKEKKKKKKKKKGKEEKKKRQLKYIGLCVLFLSLDLFSVTIVSISV